jgi:hypothetical protein
VIASIGGKEYRLSDVLELRRSGYESDKQIFEGYRRWYRNELLALEAKARGFDGQPSFLIDTEYSKVKRQITDADIDAYYRTQHTADGTARPTGEERERFAAVQGAGMTVQTEFIGTRPEIHRAFSATPPPPLRRAQF